VIPREAFPRPRRSTGMTEIPENETDQARLLRLQGQQVKPEEEDRKSSRPAEERMEDAAPREHPPRP